MTCSMPYGDVNDVIGVRRLEIALILLAMICSMKTRKIWYRYAYNRVRESTEFQRNSVIFNRDQTLLNFDIMLNYFMTSELCQ